MRNLGLEAKYVPEALPVSGIVNPQMSQNQNTLFVSLLRRSFSPFPQFGHRFDSIFCFHHISEYVEANNYLVNQKSILWITFLQDCQISLRERSFYKGCRRIY